MADGTPIEWTDATWNVITGCSVVSPGCTNCYAMQLAGTRLKNTPSRQGLTVDTKAGPVWNGEVRFNESMLDQPLRWRRPRKIFVCAHGDLFHENVPDEWLDKVFAVMALRSFRSRLGLRPSSLLVPPHIFQVLTKRPERARAYLSNESTPSRVVEQIHRMRFPDWPLFKQWPLPNVWLGVSVEDQPRAQRIVQLFACPAALYWVSLEPLLGAVDLRRIDVPGYGFLDALTPGYFADGRSPRPALGWVVAGGESGPHARPMHPDWSRQLRDQCAAAGVPFFMKQLSGPKGRAIKAIDRFPADLQIREWPDAA